MLSVLLNNSWSYEIGDWLGYIQQKFHNCQFYETWRFVSTRKPEFWIQFWWRSFKRLTTVVNIIKSTIVNYDVSVLMTGKMPRAQRQHRNLRRDCSIHKDIECLAVFTFTKLGCFVNKPKYFYFFTTQNLGVVPADLLYKSVPWLCLIISRAARYLPKPALNNIPSLCVFYDLNVYLHL